MTAEYQQTGDYQQTGIKEKSNERWHASCETKAGAVVAALNLGAAIAVHNPELKTIFASFALISATCDGICLVGDAIVGSARKKIKEAIGKQKSS